MKDNLANLTKIVKVRLRSSLGNEKLEIFMLVRTDELTEADLVRRITVDEMISYLN